MPNKIGIYRGQNRICRYCARPFRLSQLIMEAGGETFCAEQNGKEDCLDRYHREVPNHLILRPRHMYFQKEPPEMVALSKREQRRKLTLLQRLFSPFLAD